MTVLGGSSGNIPFFTSEISGYCHVCSYRRRGGGTVVVARPDLLSCKNLQEFSIKQGVGASESGPVYGSVPEKWYNGARIGSGLGAG